VVGPTAPAAERNILGVIGKVGLEIGGKVIRVRRECRDIISYLCGKVIHPVSCVPGGVSKGLDEEHRLKFLETAKFAVEFAQFALQIFDDVVLKNKQYVDLVLGDAYTMKTYYMGLVDATTSTYDGAACRHSEGREYATQTAEIRPYLRSRGSYTALLKKVGWKGFNRR
jgi:F420-non-reducing hydrogenase large subunit